MFRFISHLLFRALALLQLTRAALAFTAIADAWTILLLRPPGAAPDPMIITMGKMAVTGVVSFGLYAFGMSLNDLLAHWDAPRRIDYPSIDTEGSELDILTAFDFDAWDVRLITVEHNHGPQRQGLIELLTAKGYRRKFKHLSGVDDWYVKAG